VSAPRTPLRFDGAEGWATRPLTDELVDALAAWAERGDLSAARPVKPGRVWRVGDVAIKRFDPRHGPIERLRPSPARRSAALHARIAPVRSPAPVAVLERGGRGESLLASEFVEGGFLHELWESDPAALAALPAFMAGMHGAHVFHGDLHAGNMIWDGKDWFLIDLDGLRHPLRTLFPRQLILDHWGRLWFGVGRRPGMRPLFESYLDRMDLGWDRDDAWRAVEREAQRVKVIRLGPDA